MHHNATTGHMILAGQSSFIREVRRYQLPGVKALLVECDFAAENFAAAQFADLEITRPPQLERAVAKRQSEFLAGRWCAREALLQLGLAPVTIAIGEQRDPQWPDQVRGSITHTGPIDGVASIACCAMALAEDCRGLGIDLENLMTESLATKIHAMLMDEQEKQLLVAQQMAWAELVTLLFSSKESLFKALYPSVGRYFDFLDARLVALDWAAGVFTLELKVTLAPGLLAGARFDGQFVRRGPRLLTLVCY